MKTFFFILAFALLYISCLPCGDSQECIVKIEAKITATEDHQQHNHDSEACTPFCTCTCCAASAFYPTFSKTLINTIAFKSEEHPLYNVTFDTEAHKSIWQPPKA